MAISDADFEAANARMAARIEHEPRAVAARYDRVRRRIVIALSTGVEVSFPPQKLEGLDGATPAELSEIEISPTGFGLYFPKRDADFALDGLLVGIFGSRKWMRSRKLMAAQLGARGGKAISERKAQASRNNGRLGGRPKKQASAT